MTRSHGADLPLQPPGGHRPAPGELERAARAEAQRRKGVAARRRLEQRLQRHKVRGPARGRRPRRGRVPAQVVVAGEVEAEGGRRQQRGADLLR